MRLWRLARERYCEDRQGTGAFFGGGRWTPAGVRVIHAAESRALAGLEYLVHSSQPPADLVLVAIDLPDGAPIDQLKLDDLPKDWATPLPSKHCQAWGEKWCKTGAALALAVPSVIVHEERNYVINVAHPRMGDVKLKPVRRFAFDLRLYVPGRRLV